VCPLEYLYADDDPSSDEEIDLLCLSTAEKQSLALENDTLFRDLQTKVDRTRYLTCVVNLHEYTHTHTHTCA
jgi:hypothetical protein